ncbi:GNAT family N-acetyltransferase [Vibrio sp. IRLE0018]|uniref:GNAT family N-acetyltransferase n=1 Tax=Vibrio TaxID=662 RepID=UPI001593C8C7|nr:MULTISPECIES: GNAT family N-acetyltransferase [Vibrio]MCF8781097.1 GNAT family N-acetyltransferase [Vibrio floridensis]NVC65257.1 GNAT family N-acetyltransferase [Vibrio sp. 05-20-BW147]
MSHSIRFEVLDPIKLPLIKKIYKAHYPSAKVKRDEMIIIAQIAQQTVGVVRLRYIEQYQLLTGMLTLPNARGKGYGHALLEYCTSNHLNEDVFCFSYRHLENFYSCHGFQEIDVDKLPNTLKQKYLRYSESGKDLVPMQYRAQID